MKRRKVKETLGILLALTFAVSTLAVGKRLAAPLPVRHRKHHQ